jgi:AhpD family alkylhydroperoxidase
MNKPSKIEEFAAYREKMNNKIWAQNNKVINRFFNLDQNTYMDGALNTRTKEMLGLVASFVLRCDDCINYHLGKCHEEGITDEEIMEIFSVGTLVGGSITIPHLRRGMEFWEELKKKSDE